MPPQNSESRSINAPQTPMMAVRQLSEVASLDMGRREASHLQEFCERQLAPAIQDSLSHDREAYTLLKDKTQSLMQRQLKACRANQRAAIKTMRFNTRELAQIERYMPIQDLCARGLSLADAEDWSDKQTVVLQALAARRRDRSEAHAEATQEQVDAHKREWDIVSDAQAQHEKLSGACTKSLRTAMDLRCSNSQSVAEYLEKRISFFTDVLTQLTELELKVRDRSHRASMDVRAHDLRRSYQEVDAYLGRKRQELDEFRTRESLSLQNIQETHDYAIRQARDKLEERQHTDRHELERMESHLKARGLFSFLFS